MCRANLRQWPLLLRISAALSKPNAASPPLTGGAESVAHRIVRTFSTPTMSSTVCKGSRVGRALPVGGSEHVRVHAGRSMIRFGLTCSIGSISLLDCAGMHRSAVYCFCRLFDIRSIRRDTARAMLAAEGALVICAPVHWLSSEWRASGVAAAPPPNVQDRAHMQGWRDGCMCLPGTPHGCHGAEHFVNARCVLPPDAPAARRQSFDELTGLPSRPSGSS